MDSYDKYSISTEILFEPLKVMDIPKTIAACSKSWQNFSLCEVNDSVVRLGVIHGEFHWHKHDKEDEFFYVIDGRLLLDINDETHVVGRGEGFLVPKGVTHRTRAPVRTAILMVEGKDVTPTGD